MTGESLDYRLQIERSRSLIRQAELVRDWPDGPERAAAAQEIIRDAFVAWSLGRITQDTESRIYTVVGFAMPNQSSAQDAAAEAAFEQQQERRTCPECGDGFCST